MKTTATTLLMALALALPAANLLAQDDDQPRLPRGPRFQERRDRDSDAPRGEALRDRGPRPEGERPRGPRPDGDRPEGPRPPLPPPLMAALDGNRDGVIDETEIANASAALKSLDKNGDGKVTFEEMRPRRPLPPREGELGDRPDAPRRELRAREYRRDADRPERERPDDAPRGPRPLRDEN